MKSFMDKHIVPQVHDYIICNMHKWNKSQGSPSNEDVASNVPWDFQNVDYALDFGDGADGDDPVDADPVDADPVDADPVDGGDKKEEMVDNQKVDVNINVKMNVKYDMDMNGDEKDKDKYMDEDHKEVVEEDTVDM
eukprot:269407_1